MDNFFIKKYPAVKNKSFVRLLTSQLLSQSGGYIQNVALSELITEMTPHVARYFFVCVLCARFPVLLFCGQAYAENSCKAYAYCHGNTAACNVIGAYFFK